MLTNPVKVKQLIKAAGEAFVLDTGGVPIEDFIFTMRGVTGNELTMLRTNNGTFNANGNNTEGSERGDLDDVPGGQAGQARRVRLHQPRACCPTASDAPGVATNASDGDRHRP